MAGSRGGIHSVQPHIAELNIMQSGNLGDGVFPVKQETICTGNLQISSHSICGGYGDLTVCSYQIIRIVPELVLAIIPCLAVGQFIGGCHRPTNVAVRVVSGNDDIVDIIDRKIPFACANLSQTD